MAELPDVEIFKIYLQTTSLQQKIKDIKERDHSLLQKVKFPEFKKKLAGTSFKKVRRKGSFLIIELEGTSQKLVFGFGPTGDLHYTRSEEDFQKEDHYTKLIFDFDNEFELRLISIRDSRGIYLVKDLKEIESLGSLGESPLEIEKKDFLDLLMTHKNLHLKTFLMNPEILAGIGDVYSDEISFQTGLDPERLVKSLSTKERKDLFRTMKEVLTAAIDYTKKGSFPSSWLREHREDMICPLHEKHHLNKELIDRHRAIFCPECQK